MNDPSKREQIPEIIEALFCPYCMGILELCPSCFVLVCPGCARKYGDKSISEAEHCDIEKVNGKVTVIPEGMPECAWEVKENIRQY